MAGSPVSNPYARRPRTHCARPNSNQIRDDLWQDANHEISRDIVGHMQLQMLGHEPFGKPSYAIIRYPIRDWAQCDLVMPEHGSLYGMLLPDQEPSLPSSSVALRPMFSDRHDAPMRRTFVNIHIRVCICQFHTQARRLSLSCSWQINTLAEPPTLAGSRKRRESFSTSSKPRLAINLMTFALPWWKSLPPRAISRYG